MSDHEDETITEENTPSKVVPQITTAKFGGNAESKKMQKSLLKQKFKEFRISEEEGLDKGYDKMQKILTQMNTLKIKPEPEDVNMKFVRGLPPYWTGVALILITKGGLEYISFDDLYNKLKFLEIDTKGYTSSSSTLSNAVFVSTTGSSQGNLSYQELGDGGYTTTLSVSPGSSSSKGSSKTKCSVVDDVIYSFFANHEIDQHLVYEDLDQMNKEEFKEYDLKYQMAMHSIKVHRFEKKHRRKIKFNGRENASCKQMGHFSRECRAQGGQNSNNYHKYKSKEAGKDISDSKAMVVVDDADSEGKVVSADDAIPAGVFVFAGDVAADVVSPQSEIEFALMGLSTEVFSTWMAFGGNTHDLGSFGEEKGKITDLHQILEEMLLTECGDGVTSIKRHHENPIHTLGDYSKPSHEDYMNTIELPEGNNMDPSPHRRILLLVSLLNSFHREGMQNFEMKSCCSNNIMENLYLKHRLVSRTYYKTSLIMASIVGFKSKFFMTMSILSQDELLINRPVVKNKQEKDKSDQNRIKSRKKGSDPSPHRRILLLVFLLNSFHREGMQNFAMKSCCSNNIMENLYLKHRLVSRTYYKTSLIMASIVGFKSKFFMTMSILSQDELLINRPVALDDFDSHQEKRLSHLRTQLEQKQDDMIGKINLLWKTISENLNDAPILEPTGNSMASENINSINHIEREELKRNGIKSPSKLFSPKYLSPASIVELNKNPSAPKRVHFVNLIVILSKENKAEE
nr:hypothetical protein [Tanacetum cinerariifolium]